MRQITITPQTGTRTLISALFTVTTLLVHRLIDKVRRMLNTVHKWFNTYHDFGDKEDEIILTGWQYLGVGAISMTICFLLSIEW